MEWTVIGAPLNSSAEEGGEALAPAALRRAGLVKGFGARDAGDIEGRIGPAVRDPASGVLGLPGLLTASDELCDRVGGVLDVGGRALVVGGDCTLLLGVGVALQRRYQRPGLWFVDGHTDTYDGATSPTGEAADMELGALTGHGPAELAAAADRQPVIAPERVIVLGHRHPDDAEDTLEYDLVDPLIRRIDARTLRAEGAAAAATRAERELRDTTDAAWLHIDLDVLDEEALPAVSYPQPGGLDWNELSELLEPLFASPRLAGVSVADLDSERDPEDRHARRVVELLVGSRARAL